MDQKERANSIKREKCVVNFIGPRSELSVNKASKGKEKETGFLATDRD
jgi:hypothetical protein